MLIPVNLPRIIEDLRMLEATLTSLGRTEEEYSVDTISELAGRNIVGIGISQAEYELMEPERRELCTGSIEEFQRDAFDQAWKDYCISLRRLGILLNDGDTDVFDCDWNTRFTLKNIWDTVERCAIEKPEFVEGGPQFLAAPAVFTCFMLRHLRSDLLRKSGQGEQADIEESQPRYTPPNCPKCGNKMKVTTTKKQLRHLACTNPDCEHSFKQSKASTNP